MVRKQSATRSASKSPRASGGYLLDRLLVPRIRQYGYNNDYTDVEAVADYLRKNYKEYQRKQQTVFFKLVARAVQIISNKEAAEEQREYRLQQAEALHVHKHLKGAGPSSSGGTGSEHEEGAPYQDHNDEGGDGSTNGSSADSFEEEEDSAIGENIEVDFIPDPREVDQQGAGAAHFASPSTPRRPQTGGYNLLNSSLCEAYDKPFLLLDPNKAKSPLLQAQSTMGPRRGTSRVGDYSLGEGGSAVSANHFSTRRVSAPLQSGRSPEQSIALLGEQARKGPPTLPLPAGGGDALVGPLSPTIAKIGSPGRNSKDASDVDMERPNEAIKSRKAGTSNSKVRPFETAFAPPEAIQAAAAAAARALRTGGSQDARLGTGEFGRSGGETPGGRRKDSRLGQLATPPILGAVKDEKIIQAPLPDSGSFWHRQQQLQTKEEKQRLLDQELEEYKQQKDELASNHFSKGGGDGHPSQQEAVTDVSQQQAGGKRKADQYSRLKGEQSPKRVRREARGRRQAEGRDSQVLAGEGVEMSAQIVPRQVKFKDLGGIEGTLQSIRELIEYPLAHPELYKWLGVEPPRGVLLHGPPGCGKTMLAHAIAVETGVPFLKISAPEVVSGMSGESEAKIRSLFGDAERLAPCIIFIDEIDAITPKRETAQREMERRIVAQLLTCMDDLNSVPTAASEVEALEGVPQKGHVVVIGATNRPDSLDPALRRAGRFDREISLGIPDESARGRILEVLARRLRLQGQFDFKRIARRTPGFVGADLAALTKEAAAIAVKRIFSSLAEPSMERLALTSHLDAGKFYPVAEPPGTGLPLSMLPAFADRAAAACPVESPGKMTKLDGTHASGKAAPSLVHSEEGKQVQVPQGAESKDESLEAPKPRVGSRAVDGYPSGSLQEATAEYISLESSPCEFGDGPGVDRIQRSACTPVEGVGISAPAWGPIGSTSMELSEAGDSWRRQLTRDELQGLSITMEDFEAAVGQVQPSAKREGFTTIPDVTWEDVGSLGEVREELEFSISRPIKHPEDFQAMGLDLATGVLLFGPPGCGKTLVAKAIANDAGANFISIKGPELLNKYVGESERAVRQLFQRARASAPCVLFFDEMDAMAPTRGSDGNAAAERVVNQLLTEMDGLESRRSVFLIAATNRPDMIDPALLRPGRLDKLLYVPLPDPQGRASILRTLVRCIPLDPGVDVGLVGESNQCEGFSGADLAALVREACVASLRERCVKAEEHQRQLSDVSQLLNSTNRSSSRMQVPILGPPRVLLRHFEEAFMKVQPSVSPKDVRRYEGLRQKLRGARGHLPRTPSELPLEGGKAS